MAESARHRLDFLENRKLSQQCAASPDSARNSDRGCNICYAPPAIPVVRRNTSSCRSSNSLTDLPKRSAPIGTEPVLFFFLFVGHPDHRHAILGSPVKDCQGWPTVLNISLKLNLEGPRGILTQFSQGLV